MREDHYDLIGTVQGIYKPDTSNILQTTPFLGTVVIPSTSNTAPSIDIVNAPPHYSRGKYQVWDIIEYFKLNYNLGNVCKYILRAGKKTDNPIEDYKKAIAYLQREVDILEGRLDVRPK